MNMTNTKRYISTLLVLLLLATSTLAVIGDDDEGKKDVTAQAIGVEPGKKDVTAQGQTNQTNETENVTDATGETPVGTPPISIPIITPTRTTTPEPTDVRSTPGFEIVLAVAVLFLANITRRH